MLARRPPVLSSQFQRRAFKDRSVLSRCFVSAVSRAFAAHAFSLTTGLGECRTLPTEDCNDHGMDGRASFAPGGSKTSSTIQDHMLDHCSKDVEPKWLRMMIQNCYGC